MRHPRLFHMAEEGAWPHIQRHGLLSTTALLDRFGVQGDERFRIESMRRPDMIEISHVAHGRALIRDNKPLREQFLLQCLDGMSAREWYETLNRKVFFWVRPERLDTLVGARAYRNRAHDVLIVDTRALLDRHRDDVTLAAINTGATLYPSAPRRGASTFVPVGDYDWVAMKRWRGAANAIVELAVDYAVPDVADIALRVERRRKDEAAVVLWARTS